MGRPNVMAETDSSRVTRAAFHSNLQEMEDLLTGAFGPEGRAVLIQSPTGQMTITRSGFNILRAIYADNDSPSKKILLDFVEKLHEECGDGVKSFIFTTTAMLKYCECLERPSRLLQQVGKLQYHLSQLRANLECTKSTDFDAKDCSNAKIIHTFLGTRFPALISAFITTLLHEWVSKHSSCICNNDKHVDRTQNCNSLVKDFSILCHYDTGSRSISDSRVKQGFLVSRSPINLFRSGQHKLLILSFDDEDSSKGKFDQLDIICEVGRLLSDIKVFKKEAKDRISCVGFLVLTPAILPELAIFSLKRENVAIIHGAPISEVKYISRVMARFQEGLTADFKYSLVDVVYEVGDDYTFFNIPSLFNVFICGPTNELRAEYAQACRCALKLLLEANKITPVNRVVDGGGGDFERNLQKFVLDKCDLYKKAVPCLGDRTELLRWHREKLKGRPSTLESVESGKMYEMISETFCDVDRDIVEGVLVGIMSVPRKLPVSVPRSNQSEVTEPIALKLLILQYALAAVIMIIKIDGTVYTKNVPKNVLTK